MDMIINTQGRFRSWSRFILLSTLSMALSTVSAGMITQIPENETELQYKTLQRDINRREQILRNADQTFEKQSLILESDRDPADVIL